MSSDTKAQRSREVARPTHRLVPPQPAQHDALTVHNAFLGRLTRPRASLVSSAGDPTGADHLRYLLTDIIGFGR